MDVLIVEDNAATRRLLVDVLQASRYQCVAVASAEEGIELAQRHPPRVILIDINLPGMDGVTATACLRKVPALNGTKIIGMSAHALKIEQDMLEIPRFDHFITKPFSYKWLLEFLTSIL